MENMLNGCQIISNHCLCKDIEIIFWFSGLVKIADLRIKYCNDIGEKIIEIIQILLL